MTDIYERNIPEEAKERLNLMLAKISSAFSKNDSESTEQLSQISL